MNCAEVTAKGIEKIREFVTDLEIRRSELIHAGYADEDDETILPEIQEIIDDIPVTAGVDGIYVSDWKATENDKPRVLTLIEGEDYITA
jgi:hypothetical protein